MKLKLIVRGKCFFERPWNYFSFWNKYSKDSLNEKSFQIYLRDVSSLWPLHTGQTEQKWFISWAICLVENCDLFLTQAYFMFLFYLLAFKYLRVSFSTSWTFLFSHLKAGSFQIWSNSLLSTLFGFLSH